MPRNSLELLGGVVSARGYLLPSTQLLSWLVFLGLWVLISTSDTAQKKILHKDLLFGTAFACVCYALMFAGTVMGHFGRVAIYYHLSFYRDLAGHIIIAFAAAMALWWARIWPAGDAKLFALLSLIFPMMPSAPPFHAGWLSLFVMINIFIPACLMVFYMAARYVYSTRFRQYPDFMRQLWRRGWRLVADYLLQNLKTGLVSAFSDLGELASWALAHPGEVVLSAARWFMSMGVMCVFCVSIQKLFASPTVRILLALAVMFLWSRVEAFVGRWLGWTVASALLILAWTGKINVHWHDLEKMFGYMMVFSLFLSLGMRATLGAVKGQFIMMGIPLLGAVAGLFPWRLLGRWSGWSGQMGWNIIMTFGPLACLGAFFGLSFVFVRIWDDEDHPNVPRDKILSYMLPHHSMVARMQQDPEFFERYFRSLYADGLTVEQAKVLRGWCARNSIDIVPMTTTIPFSNWIFLGFFMTWLFAGHILQPFFQ
jgi:hypothetical protein